MLVKPIFETLKNKKVQIILAVLAVIFLFYNLFFRFSVKVFNINQNQTCVKVVKTDNFTGEVKVERVCESKKNNPKRKNLTNNGFLGTSDLFYDIDKEVEAEN